MENIIYVVDINPKNLWIYYNIFDEDNENAARQKFIQGLAEQKVENYKFRITDIKYSNEHGNILGHDLMYNTALVSFSLEAVVDGKHEIDKIQFKLVRFDQKNIDLLRRYHPKEPVSIIGEPGFWFIQDDDVGN